MSDAETLAVYNRQADDYVAMMDEYAANDPRIHDFIAACPQGGRVLDLGSGPGAYAVQMAAAGLHVDAIDAASEMVARIAEIPGISARVATFDDIDGADIYDGIWASFSLLHAPREAMPRHLAALRRALKPGGVFFIGMKLGQGGKRDDIGRHYEYYSREELETLLQDAGLAPYAHWTGQSKGLDQTYHGWIVIQANG
ncbi:class I SAM-dependent methyltransferase [Aestuariivita sp.]|jgi:SAM-dependent methyltransferase|uniref:class I SAM-dependent methyltransferase n=1 Tax=Aestuariivita sp. TaxID=1872407 RepID=UPI00216D32C4|nr:class I SAM-dependent methyltransferase [Aestuariivita sp.]MCE8006786.1 class I SAM-dependent methyltransferase [Aestuariivita sp.]